jgi:hypothetical protein
MAVATSGDCSRLVWYTLILHSHFLLAMVSTRSRKPLPSSPTPTTTGSRTGRPPTTPRSNNSRPRSVLGSAHSAGSASSANKPAAFDSDDNFLYSDAESVPKGPPTKPRTLKSSSSVKSESSTGSRTRLPRNIEKALLQDITKSGGIALYDAGKSQGLCDLLNSNKELFGPWGDNIRTRIGQRVRYLKSLPEEKYKKVLKKAQVKVKSSASDPPSAIKTKGEELFSDLEDDSQEDEPEPDFVQSAAKELRPEIAVSSGPVPVQIRSSASIGKPQPKVASPCQ